MTTANKTLTTHILSTLLRVLMSDTQRSILADILNSLRGSVDGSVRDIGEKAVNRMPVELGGHAVRGRVWEKMLFAGADAIVV